MLDLLAGVTDVKVISAPTVMVLNNQEARLQVGDQVSVATQLSTQTTQDPVTGDSDFRSNVELRDTGVILTVTPRVNEGGLVIMEIDQEVSRVDQDASAGPLTPTIETRNITTKSGVPGLMKIPFIGALFRSTTDVITRNELLVMVTPRVVTNTREAREITDELRRRMEDLERLEAKVYRNTEQPEEDQQPGE